MIGVFVQINADSRYAKSKPIGYVICENGCWEWVGTTVSSGYGHIWVNGKHAMSHRHVYELHRGPIPPGLNLDHLCRNRKCVRPDHLEPVTHRENVLRGCGATAINARKVTCAYGHPLTDGESHGGRWCKQCLHRQQREYTEQHKARTKRRRQLRKLFGTIPLAEDPPDR